MASRGTILFGSDFLKQLERCVDKPLDALKREVIDRLKLVEGRLPMTELNINEIVL
jgi:hypothetical protein